jgi:hypothetical protein
MIGWTPGRFKEVNVEQFATPTDRLLGRMPIPPRARGSTTNMYDETVPQLGTYRRKAQRPNLLTGAFVFSVGVLLGMLAIAWPLT